MGEEGEEERELKCLRPMVGKQISSGGAKFNFSDDQILCTTQGRQLGLFAETHIRKGGNWDCLLRPTGGRDFEKIRVALIAEVVDPTLSCYRTTDFAEFAFK